MTIIISRTRFTRAALAALVSVLSFFLANASSAAEAQKSFDIPTGDALTALKQFAVQSDEQLLYSAEAVQGVTTNAIKGTFTARDALDQMVKGTRLTVIADRKNGALSLVRVPDPNAQRVAQTSSDHPSQGSSGNGSISGSLKRPAGGAAVKGLTATVLETGNTDLTDGAGRFFFSGLTDGTYTVIVSGNQYPDLRITRIAVRANTGTELAPVTMPIKTGAEVAGMKQSDVLQLEKYEVMGRKPFTDQNVDVVRTMNDVQPYYIFDAPTIAQSGATNIEDFLKSNLTMNTEAGTIGQGRTVYGGSSSINFIGLGTLQTLILIDGRRLPAEILAGTPHQPPLNGIPLAAIDRVEVLPSSASAIYGGAAMAGVVNVILKKDFNGGELGINYDNTFTGRSPIRTVDLTDGFTLANGKLHALVTAHYSEARPISFQDRSFINDYFSLAIARNPTLARYTSYAYATPNITSTSGNLVLKNGTPLNSPETFVPAGTAPGSNLTSGLLANAGLYNSTLVPFGGGTGEYSNVEQGFRQKMLRGSLTWDVTSSLQAFFDLSTASYAASLAENGLTFGTVPTAAPTNPFLQTVTVAFPEPQIGTLYTNNVIDVMTVGLKGSISADWQAELDYTWSSDNLFSFNNANFDTTALNADLASGAINPFSDTVKYPINYNPYREPVVEGFPSTLNDVGLRVSGNVFHLPAGSIQLVTGLEHRTEGVRDGYLSALHPANIPASTLADYFGNSQSNNSAYAEAVVPVLKTDGLIRFLEAQLAGRYDAYSIGSGTASASVLPNATPPTVTYSPATAAPFHTTIKYTSTNPTVGFKLELPAGFMLRTSYSTAFLPPTLAQLTPNPTTSTSLTTVTDPTTNKSYGVSTRTGGNPALTPQKAKDWDAGAVYAPPAEWLKGLRFDLEYYHIEEENVIGTLTAQQLTNLQSSYPNRITRDPTSGLITLVDISSLNLYKLVTEGWDTTVSWEHNLPLGTLRLSAMGTIITHYAQEIAPGAPLLEYAGYANDGGPAKLKANFRATWERGPWTLGWTVSYFGSYKQSGAPGSPIYAGNPLTPLTTTYLLAQNGDHVPSQVYDDVFVAYKFPRRIQGHGRIGDYLLDDWRLQVGVKDVFNRAPPLDAFNASVGAPYSFYGDPRLRHYWLTINRDF